MEAGIVGFPLSGKTMIFNAITGLEADTSAHSGGKNKVNLCEVKVPDDRLYKLKEIFSPKKVVHATILVKDIQLDIDSNGHITPSSVAEMRTLDAIVLVLRAFKSEEVMHHADEINPVKDLDSLIDSFIFSDFEVCEKRIQRLEKESNKTSREYQLLTEATKTLSDGKLIGPNAFEPADKKIMSGFRFLSEKPIIVVANIGSDSVDIAPLKAKSDEYGLGFFEIRADIEMEISQLPEEDQKDFLADIGVTEPAVKRFVTNIYSKLNLLSFLTAGEDECRAWSVRNGAAAPEAAGKIHTDLEKGFIRAEVIEWDALVEAGGFSEAKKNNKLRLEGKGYIVKDGDVLNIRFNV
ncbi:MAG: redox-regulated ATPase YchF [Spirochaetales bacterium]|nr:redox-regulated ATPase YchF [Spirochaetales bacterium]